MRKLMLIAIAIVAMAGIVNAQSLCRDIGCTCDSGINSGPGSCDLVASGVGACDKYSMCVDLSTDLANCGSVGHSCAIGMDCWSGVCEDDGSGFGGLQPSAPPSAQPPLALKSKHNDITDAVRSLRRTS